MSVRLSSACASCARHLFFSFSFCSSVAHSALGCDDVGDRRFSFGVGASVARPCSSVSFASVGSSVSSRDKSHLAGPSSLPTSSVASVRRSGGFNQSRCGNASAKSGQSIAVGSHSEPGVAPPQASSKVIFNRQVAIVDLGLANSHVATRRPMPWDKQAFGSPSADGDPCGCLLHGALDGFVVGSSVYGRQPQQLPCSLNCVLRLRGGSSSSISSSEDDEAAGSGIGDDRDWLNDDRGATQVVSVGVLAREEGHRHCVSDFIAQRERVFQHYQRRMDVQRVPPRFTEVAIPVGVPVGSADSVIEASDDELVHPLVHRIYSPIYCDPDPRFTQTRIPSPFLEIPKDATSASSSGNLHVVEGNQDVDLDRSTILENDAGSFEEEFAACPPWSLPFVVSSSDAFVPVRRLALSRSASVEGNPPSVSFASRYVMARFGCWRQRSDQFDDILVRYYGYPANGRQLLPPNTPLYNKFSGGELPARLHLEVVGTICFRNIKVGEPAVANGGRKANTPGSAVRVKCGHHVGSDHFAPGCNVDLSFLGRCHIVYIDTYKVHLCSTGSVCFHSFIWLRNVGTAKSIVRALFSNHCNWADILIVRGRCFGLLGVCFRATRVLEDLLWIWATMGRPYLVYQEGNNTTLVCDPIPAWLIVECVYKDFCQCHIVGLRLDGRQHPGALYGNVVSRDHQLVGGRCCCLPAVFGFPHGYNTNIKIGEIATKLSSAMVQFLEDLRPSLPQRGEPLVSVLTSREHKPKWERVRFMGLKRRHIQRLKRRNAKFKEEC